MKFKKLFEDKDVLVIDKPSGLVVNRSSTSKSETLQDQIVDYLQLKNLGIGERAGIVHRLDRETTGLMIVAKTVKVFEYLQLQFKNREIKKEYIALVHGNIVNSQGKINEKIGRIGKFGKFGIVHDGRESVTEYEVKERFIFDDKHFNNFTEGFTKVRILYLKSQGREYSLLKILPKTGRTHQIRVHLKSIHYPVVSDDIYTPNKLLKFDHNFCPRLFLHASYIEFKIKKSKEALKFKLDLPSDLIKSLDFLTIK